MHEIGSKFFEKKKGKTKPPYAACTLEYYPKASDVDEETREGCVLILNEHFVDVNEIHADMFDYTNAQLIVLKMQGYGNKEGKDGEFINKPILFVLFNILNHMKEEDSDANDESISDNKSTAIKDGLYAFYCATMDRALKEMFPQCRQFADLIFAISGLGIGTFLLCFLQRLCWHVWDCVNIYLVANPVSYPHYLRLGFRLMCMVEKGQVQDWKKVKRNVRECAEMEGVATKINKPLVLKLFLKEDNWSLASMCLCFVPSSSINLASDVCLTDKYKKVIKAGVVELGKKPIAVVDHCMQQIAIDAFMKQLGLLHGSGVSNPMIVCHCLDAFWEKAVTAQIMRDGHLTIYELLASYKRYLTMNLYDDLMMLNKLELELLTNVTVVRLFTDPNEMVNICCNFYCYKCEKFIGKQLGGFSLHEVTINGGDIVYGHYFGKVVVPLSLVYLNKA
jgi:hypothetical protein